MVLCSSFRKQAEAACLLTALGGSSCSLPPSISSGKVEELYSDTVTLAVPWGKDWSRRGSRLLSRGGAGIGVALEGGVCPLELTG